MSAPPRAVSLDRIHKKFGDVVNQNVPLAPLTSARIGGPADVLVTIQSAEELLKVINY